MSEEFRPPSLESQYEHVHPSNISEEQLAEMERAIASEGAWEGRVTPYSAPTGAVEVIRPKNTWEGIKIMPGAVMIPYDHPSRTAARKPVRPWQEAQAAVTPREQGEGVDLGNVDRIIAAQRSERAEAEMEGEFRATVTARVNEIEHVHSRFALQALEQGASAEDLPNLLGHAMTEGRLPAVVSLSTHARMLDSWPVFLNGNIPGNALSVTIVKGIGGASEPKVVVRSVLELEPETDVFRVAEESNGAFTVLTEQDIRENLSPQQGRDAVLGKLDEALAPFLQQ